MATVLMITYLKAKAIVMERMEDAYGEAFAECQSMVPVRCLAVAALRRGELVLFAVRGGRPFVGFPKDSPSFTELKQHPPQWNEPNELL